MDSIECVVIGAGVVGLACGRALAQGGREVVVVEAADTFGSETSARNSEVIHAGIYYPVDSLKARLCVEGAAMLYDYCGERSIPHRRCGKLIVATDHSQVPRLRELQQRGGQNGVQELEWLERAEVQALEPALNVAGALHSAGTGIIDSHQFMLSLIGDLEASGGVIAYGARFVGGRLDYQGSHVVQIADAQSREQYRVRTLVNCAGLNAVAVLEALQSYPPDSIPTLRYAKGNYFSYAGPSPFKRLVYPAPQQAGLGIHATLDLGGRLRFGPDVEWVKDRNYDVAPQRADEFYTEIRKYWPELPDNTLIPAYSGIRPKLVAEGQPSADFIVDGPDRHGISGLVNLLGIESPGLTASLALAELVRVSLTV